MRSNALPCGRTTVCDACREEREARIEALAALWTSGLVPLVDPLHAGPCAACGATCERYGPKGRPLCFDCGQDTWSG